MKAESVKDHNLNKITVKIEISEPCQTGHLVCCMNAERSDVTYDRVVTSVPSETILVKVWRHKDHK